MMKLSYWVDLADVTLAEEGQLTWIQGATIGKYHHPVHGEIDLTPERLNDMANGVKQRVRGQDLDIDYDHKQLTTEAAGWIKDAEVRSDGLYLAIEWTKNAAQKIKEKAYRYFSPEFTFSWKHPKTGAVHKNVLFGGALTNRPFLKDIAPINMSEILSKEGEMDPAALRAALGLPADATDAQVTEKLTAAGLGVIAKPEDKKEPEASTEKVETAPQEDKKESEQTPEQIAASESLKKLSEENPAVKALTEMVDVQQKQLSEALKAIETLNKDKKATAAELKLNEWTANGKYAIPPAVHEDIKVLLSEAPTDLHNKIVNVFDTISKTGVVELGERGGKRPKDGGRSAAEVFEEKANALIKASDGKLSYPDAVVQLSSDEPALFEQYRREATFAGRE